MSPKAAHLGGRLSRKQREKKETRKKNFEKYKTVKAQAEEFGKDTSKLLRTDIPNDRLLKKLGLKVKPVKRFIIQAHGRTNEFRDYIKVPKNMIFFYLGEIGKVTIIQNRGSPCNIPPRQIALPGDKVPDLDLSPSRGTDKWVSGLYNCSGERITYLLDPEHNFTINNPYTRLSTAIVSFENHIPPNHYGIITITSCQGIHCEYTPQNLKKFTKGFDASRTGFSLSEKNAWVANVHEKDGFMYQTLNFPPTDDTQLLQIVDDLYMAIITYDFAGLVNNTIKFTRKYPNKSYKRYTPIKYINANNKAATFMQNHVHFLQAIDDGNQAAISYLWSKVFNDEETKGIVLPLCEYIYYARVGGNHALARWMQDLELKPYGSSAEDVIKLGESKNIMKAVFGVFDKRYDHPDSTYWKQNRQQTGGFSLFNRPPPPMTGGFFICY